MAAQTKVVITGIEAFAYHGCLPEEREKGQDFLVDVELEYDAAAAVRGDDLEAAIDYDRLAAEVHDLVTRRRFNLIETLAASIGEHVMSASPASRVRVRVHKPQAPTSCRVRGVAVEVVRERDGR